MARTAQQVREHWEVERRLAERIMAASKTERLSMYRDTYEELYARVPHHPQLTKKNAQSRVKEVDVQRRLLRRFIKTGGVFLEIGAGDCALSFSLAKDFSKVYGLDVSETITAATTRPGNFTLILSDGCTVPLLAGTVDVAYSNQLIEHLHPEDALEQLQNVFRALKVGGRYVCVTPNRVAGPHDISRGFAATASGLHLKEYDSSEMLRIFRGAGFQRVRAVIGLREKGFYVEVPAWILLSIEQALVRILSARRLRTVANGFPLRGILQTLTFVGIK